jgi:hypothetical protein
VSGKVCFLLFILILFRTSFAETLHFEVILYYTLGLVSRNENKLCSICGIADGTFGSSITVKCLDRDFVG